jgi:ribose 5-phosphate isomerase B
MIIYLGADHNGFKLKEVLKDSLMAAGYTVADLGNKIKDENDDYVDFAIEVAKKVSLEFETARGILICGSGVGVDVVANKFKNVRCGLIMTPDQAFDARNDDDINILALPANYLDEESAKKILVTWLKTPFSTNPKYKRRLDKITYLEIKLLRDTSVLLEDQNEKKNVE